MTDALAPPQPRIDWDAAGQLEALGAGHVALWTWEPERDRLRLTGPWRSLGLGPVGSDSTAAALRALVHPQDAELVDAFLRVRPPGADVSAQLRMRGGAICAWRGQWLEDGVRAAGVVASDSRFGLQNQDRLTGLLDRSGFLVQARETLQREEPFQLVVADLNRLRRLNEALGHERADLVLAALAARLAAAFPAETLPARIGEDEFAVLLPQDEAGANAGETLRIALEQPLRVAGFDIFPTMAVGAVQAFGGPDAPEAAELLRRAELAVEAAKGAGTGAAAAYGRALETDSLSRLAMEADLRVAFQRHEVEAFYQPVVRLETGAVAGFEALVRWRHPRRGLTAPDDFLPLAAEMGLMPEIGRFMMKSAARQLQAWRRKHEGAHHIWISVNLSPGEVDREGLITEIAGLVRDNELPPKALKLEITETDIMQDPERAAETLNALRGAGASIALDDFGTGFSSLSYLTRLPFDTLKIDRYFVRTMAANEGSAKIVRSVVALGRDLSLEVVAEGVENAIMARTLLDLGCHYGQGFGYAPALTSQDAEVYLTESLLDGAAPVKRSG